MESDDLRVSDAERQRVADALQKAVGEGYITLSEFEERTAQVWEARTRGDLKTVVADIPGAQPLGPTGDAVATPSAGTSVSHTGQPLEIRGKGSTITRKGRWEVPPALKVENRYGSTVLDFTDAVFTSAVVDIEIDNKAGDIKIVVPEDATVDINGVEAKWGEVRCKVSSGPPNGQPHFVVHGDSKYGEVRVRYPRTGSIWDIMGMG